MYAKSLRLPCKFDDSIFSRPSFVPVSDEHGFYSDKLSIAVDPLDLIAGHDKIYPLQLCMKRANAKKIMY